MTQVTKRICVIGCGYVGLTTGLHLSGCADAEISFIEQNAERLASLTEGRLPITEPGLEELFFKASSRLKFYKSLSLASDVFDHIYICVGTPSNADGISLEQMADACQDIKSWIAAKKIKNLLLKKYP